MYSYDRRTAAGPLQPIEVSFDAPLPKEARALLSDPAVSKPFGLAVAVRGSRAAVITAKRAFSPDRFRQQIQSMLSAWMAEVSKIMGKLFLPRSEMDTYWKGVTIDHASIHLKGPGGGISLVDANAMIRFLNSLPYVNLAKMDRLDTVVDTIHVQFGDPTPRDVLWYDVREHLDDSGLGSVGLQVVV